VAADGAVDGGAEAGGDVAVGGEAGEFEAEVVAGPVGGGADGLVAVGGGWGEGGEEGVAPVVGGVGGGVGLAGAEQAAAWGGRGGRRFTAESRAASEGGRTAGRRRGGAGSSIDVRPRGGGRRGGGRRRPCPAGREVQSAAKTWLCRRSGSSSVAAVVLGRGDARVGSAGTSTAGAASSRVTRPRRRGAADASARAARIRSRRTAAGSSFGSWGTSSPRKALARMAWSNSASWFCCVVTKASTALMRLNACATRCVSSACSCRGGSGIHALPMSIPLM
jgi:hypothetical protein